MTYYDNGLDTAEASFDDPTDELEANGAADDPDGDLGDGAVDPRKRKKLPTDFEPARARARGFGD